jgi:hypothetical protein
MDKSYITSLLKRDSRTLDLYEIKEIIDALVDNNIDSWQAINFMDRKEKDYFSELRQEHRERLTKEGKKPTEALLEDLVRTDPRWTGEFLNNQKLVYKAGTLYRENYKKWERTYQACVMAISAKNKNTVI